MANWPGGGVPATVKIHRQSANSSAMLREAFGSYSGASIRALEIV